MHMHDIKFFVKNEKELETLIQTIGLYSQDIGVEYVIEKCAMLIMTSRKKQIKNGIELANLERMIKLEEKKNYQHLGILEADTPSNKRKWRKKSEKSISDKRENSSKLNSAAGILSKG